MDEPLLSAAQAATYLQAYARQYRREYARCTAPTPSGAGYPKLPVSGFIEPATLTCYVTRNGYALGDESHEPPEQWWIAGGSALMVDTEPSSRPPEVIHLLKDHGLLGKPTGIYRIVPSAQLTIEEWTGALPSPTETERRTVDDLIIDVKSYKITWEDLVSRLTFGAIGKTLDFNLPAEDGPFWEPHGVFAMGFFPATMRHRRWFRRLELSPHVSAAAWDIRALRTRVNVDVRRDFHRAVAALDKPGGLIALPGAEPPLDLLRDRLSKLSDALTQFEYLLATQGGAVESVFHDFLAANPILLDVYGQVDEKPRFTYPSGESPTGKTFVEPDFLIRYPGNRYKLVELERPSKSLATQQGQPRAEVTQAVFQIAEWRDYINNHYDLLRSRYPGISSAPQTAVVISRATASRPANCDLPRYQALLREQLRVDELLTYDDLAQRARVALVQLSGGDDFSYRRDGP
ncbi:MAG: DUF4263 domain-containing protein [Pseudonocardia sp.]|nr:DUF4263 domain-containing protein [Pseudonocardia sp.]